MLDIETLITKSFSALSNGDLSFTLEEYSGTFESNFKIRVLCEHSIFENTDIGSYILIRENNVFRLVIILWGDIEENLNISKYFSISCDPIYKNNSKYLELLNELFMNVSQVFYYASCFVSVPSINIWINQQIINAKHSLKT